MSMTLIVIYELIAGAGLVLIGFLAIALAEALGAKE